MPAPGFHDRGLKATTQATRNRSLDSDMKSDLREVSLGAFDNSRNLAPPAAPPSPDHAPAKRSSGAAPRASQFREGRMRVGLALGNPVDHVAENIGLSVGRVASHHQGLFAVLHGDGNVIWRVARGRDGDDCAGPRSTGATKRTGPNGASENRIGSGSKPLGQRWGR